MDCINVAGAGMRRSDHGQAGQNLVDQQRGAFDHPPGAATGAEAARRL